MGAKVSASRELRATAMEIVTANSRKNFPSNPFKKVMGIKIEIKAKEVASTAKVISLEPLKAALTRFQPICIYRAMFSSIIMASSTTTPIAKARPKREKVFRVNPNQFIKIKVPIIDVGIARRILTVADQDPRKSQQTKEVRNAESNRVKINSLTDSLMN